MVNRIVYAQLFYQPSLNYIVCSIFYVSNISLGFSFVTLKLNKIICIYLYFETHNLGVDGHMDLGQGSYPDP